MSQEGQVLIFVNTRKDSQVLAQEYLKLIPQFLKPEEKEACKRVSKKLEKMNGNNKDLERMISHGIAFHHAGLLPKERKLVEDNFRKRNIKVICCTTTLSAGVNTPARLVILKKFKKHVTSGYNLTNFSGYFETGDGFSFFKPFSANEVFQMLGRAGRPGLDPLGYGIILVKNLDEKLWVEDNYFQPLRSDYILKPKYNDLVSTLNDVSVLTEQVLLRIYEEKQISLEKLKQFFERSFFYYEFRNSSNAHSSITNLSIPIEQLLMIEEIKPVNILKMYSTSKNLVNIKKKIKKIQLNGVTSSRISGYLQTQYGVFKCSFHVSQGITCSCGFKNGFSDNFGNTKNLFEFCEHVLAFLMHLIEYPDPKVQKYVEDIIPKSLRGQYILNYLLEKGLLKKDDKNMFFCTAFGKLVIRLYIAPSSAVLIREKLENKSINTYIELLKEAFNILKEEGKIRRDNFFEPLLDWCDEVPLDEILDRYNIMAGDLFTLRENVVRNIIFIQKIAEFLSKTGTDLRESMFNVMEMAETLSIRVEHGIKEELFDLVLRLNQVGRVRARILFNAGYKNASKVRTDTPYTLHVKTGLGINLCKAILGSDK
ncbi:MAG: helicase-related protein [Candidatus Helarchaeota archaeon]